MADLKKLNREQLLNIVENLQGKLYFDIVDEYMESDIGSCGGDEEEIEVTYVKYKIKIGVNDEYQDVNEDELELLEMIV